MDADVDYRTLHLCAECNSKHRLFPFPVDGGWVAATVCDCRGKTGLPQRYSTETETIPTFPATEVAICWLLHPTEVVV